MIDPRALAKELRQSGTRFAALRQLKLLLRTQQPCGGGNGGPQYCALANWRGTTTCFQSLTPWR